MKILVINWQDIRNPLAGGAEVQFHEVFRRIAAAGHSVTLYCSLFEGALNEEVLDGIRIIRRGGRRLFNYTVPLFYRELLRHEGFDVVVDDVNKIPFFTPLFVRGPLCGIVHHLFGRSIFREVTPFSAAYVFGMERLALMIYRKYRIRFMAVSPSTVVELQRRGFDPSRLHLVPLAVDHAKFRKTGTAKSVHPLIGYVGRIKKYKCIDVFLEALPAIRAKVPTVRAVIVGDGDDRPRLASLAKSLGVADVVEFTGYVSEESKVDWMQRMWCMVTPSSKEGWGLTVTEANACGTPVVASDVPGLHDAVCHRQTGMLFPFGDHAALAIDVAEILQDKDFRDRLGLAGMEFASRFTWENAAWLTMEVLNQVVAEGKR